MRALLESVDRRDVGKEERVAADKRREDPVFKKRTPLLFAHRGGAKERPESTRWAFDYARDEVHADVLELDVQVTRDDSPQFVVWHGPGLDNVLIDGRLPKDRSKQENDITHYRWAQLKEAYVAPPTAAGPKFVGMECSDRTRVLRLEEMMAAYPDTPLNIEMKDDSFRRNHIGAFIAVLDAHRGSRPIVVVSQSDSLIECFRKACEDRYPTGLSMREVLLARAKQLLPFVENRHLENRALQTTHGPLLTPKELIDEVKAAGGAVHVFLNGIWLLADELDAAEDTPTREQLFELLDRGVDGVMTDRPGWVRGLMEEWKTMNP